MKPLDLFFRGDRTYIQGSLVIAQALAGFSLAASPVLVKAAFSSLITTHCALVEDGEDCDESLLMAEIFLADDGDRRLRIVRDLERSNPPERVLQPVSFLTDFQPLSDFSAEASFILEPSLENLLYALIALNRRCHEYFAPGARNVWFLSLFDAALPLAPDPSFSHGRMRVENLSRRKYKGRFMTINNAQIKAADGQRRQLKLLFSYE